MSTLLAPRVSFHPIGHVDAQCIGCAAALSVAAGITHPLCPACERSQAWAEAARLLSDIRDLRDGSGVFAGLTDDERQEQLAALGLPSINATPRFPAFKALSDNQLIDVAGSENATIEQVAAAAVELAARLEAWAPTPRERAEIELTSIVLAGEPEDPEQWDLV